MATIEVFKYQKKKYDVSESVNRTTTNTTTSPEGFITYDEDGELVFTGGKYKLRRVVDICKNDPSYIKWMWGKNGDLAWIGFYLLSPEHRGKGLGSIIWEKAIEMIPKSFFIGLRAGLNIPFKYD